MANRADDNKKIWATVERGKIVRQLEAVENYLSRFNELPPDAQAAQKEGLGWLASLAESETQKMDSRANYALSQTVRGSIEKAQDRISNIRHIIRGKWASSSSSTSSADKSRA